MATATRSRLPSLICVSFASRCFTVNSTTSTDQQSRASPMIPSNYPFAILSFQPFWSILVSFTQRLTLRVPLGCGPFQAFHHSNWTCHIELSFICHNIACRENVLTASNSRFPRVEFRYAVQCNDEILNNKAMKSLLLWAWFGHSKRITVSYEMERKKHWLALFGNNHNLEPISMQTSDVQCVPHSKRSF